VQREGFDGQGKARGGRVVWELQDGGGVVGDGCAPLGGARGLCDADGVRVLPAAAAIEGLTLL
jgi:hypothetical protein